LNIYIAPLQGIYSEALSALDYMMLNIVMNEYFQSVRKTKLKSHQKRAHAHMWNQPTDSPWQLMGKFRVLWLQDPPIKTTDMNTVQCTTNSRISSKILRKALVRAK